MRSCYLSRTCRQSRSSRNFPRASPPRALRRERRGLQRERSRGPSTTIRAAAPAVGALRAAGAEAGRSPVRPGTPGSAVGSVGSGPPASRPRTVRYRRSARSPAGAARWVGRNLGRSEPLQSSRARSDISRLRSWCSRLLRWDARPRRMPPHRPQFRSSEKLSVVPGSCSSPPRDEFLLVPSSDTSCTGDTAGQADFLRLGEGRSQPGGWGAGYDPRGSDKRSRSASRRAASCRQRRRRQGVRGRAGGLDRGGGSFPDRERRRCTHLKVGLTGPDGRLAHLA